MSEDFPVYPPGFWRRIILVPAPGWIGAALEDEVHDFRLRLDHADGRIVNVAARTLRQPWSACRDAGAHLASALSGETLADVAAHDAKQHCTHLFDLAMLCAAHAEDTAPTRFDMQVADRTHTSNPGATFNGSVDGRTSAAIFRNGEPLFDWQLIGTMIDGPERFAGRDIRRVSTWKHDYAAAEGEAATLLRRALFVSGVRQHALPASGVAADAGTSRIGVCFNYQLPRASASTPASERKLFAEGKTEPLGAFDPAELAAL